jgi:hypothetical protein
MHGKKMSFMDEMDEIGLIGLKIEVMGLVVLNV